MKTSENDIAFHSGKKAGEINRRHYIRTTGTAATSMLLSGFTGFAQNRNPGCGYFVFLEAHHAEDVDVWAVA